MEAVPKVENLLELPEEKGSEEKAPGKELVLHNTPIHTHTPKCTANAFIN